MRYKALRSRGAVKVSSIFAGIIAAVSLWAVASARATAIDLDLGTSPLVTSKVTNSFDALNGIGLQGQTLSLDFTFSHAEFVRLFSVTPKSFIALLKLHTNSPGKLDFPNGTGFLVDQQGNPLQLPQELGSAAGDNGLLSGGLLPLLLGDLQSPLDFFGVHFDLTLPVAPSISITGEEFLFKSDGNAPFGVGPGVPSDIVPDGGSTALFLATTLAALISTRAWVTSTR